MTHSSINRNERRRNPTPLGGGGCQWWILRLSAITLPVFRCRSAAEDSLILIQDCHACAASPLPTRQRFPRHARWLPPRRPALCCAKGGLQLVHVPAQVIPDGVRHLQFFLDGHCLQGEGNWHGVIPVFLEGVAKSHPCGIAQASTPALLLRHPLILECGGNFTSALTKVWRIL